MFDVSPQIETWLSQMGVKRSYNEQVSYDELIDSWETVNDGRPDGKSKVEDAVLDYAELMKSGSPAPAVILSKAREGYIVLDGCQRLMANRLNGSHHFAAYIVTCNGDTAEMLRKFANTRLQTRAPVNTEWTLTEGVRAFIIKGDHTVAEVAMCAGVTEQKVQQILDRERLRSTLESMIGDDKKFPMPKPLTVGQIDWLAKNCTGEFWKGKPAEVMKAILSSMSQAKYANSEWTQMMERVLPKRPGKGSALETQLKSKKRAELDKNAQHQMRMSGKLKRSALDNLMTQLKGVVTLAQTYKRQTKNCPLDDTDLVTQIDEAFTELGRLLRHCCSERILDEINYPHGPFAVKRR